MVKSKRMASIAKISERGEKYAAKALLDSAQVVAEYEGKLQEMHRTKAEYCHQLSASGKAQTHGAEIQRLRLFIEQVALVIQQLEQHLHHRREAHESKLKAWRHSHHKSQAMTNIVDRHRRMEDRAREDREQDDLDDMAQRKSKRIVYT